jgi:hypothetical protein
MKESVSLQADAYLLFIRIRNGVKSLETTLSENVENPQSPEITKGYSRTLKREIFPHNPRFDSQILISDYDDLSPNF